jgi:TPR repeat protein
MHLDTSFATLYNPAEFTPEQLIDRFVVRLNTFKRLYQDISSSSMKTPEQHYLIQGRRGMGKTTLLLRLAYEMEHDPKLNTWLFPVVYNEEEHSISRLSRFWERAAEILADKHAEFATLPDEMEALYEQYGGQENQFEEAVFNLLVSRLKKHQYKVVLFVDNFGTLFRSFNDRENRRLRTVLQTCPELRIIGATPVVLGEIYDVKHPFYEFFKVERLQGLDKEETKELLVKIGEVTEKSQAIQDILTHQPGRVETLRRFTNGVIRTMVLLFDVFTDDHDGDAFHDLEVIIDRTTPLYQHRMDDLSAQQRPIVEAIALAWDAVSTKEIVSRTRLESKLVSAQLSQLCDNEIIERIQTHTKNHFYQVSERFFNIWYLMRFGRRDARKRVRWLIRFLESWCDEQTLAQRTQCHIAAMKAGNYHTEGAYLMSEALAATKFTTRELQHELLATTFDYLKGKKSGLAKNLSRSDQDLLDEAMAAAKRGEDEIALAALVKMVRPDYISLATSYIKEKNHKKAIEILLKSDDALALYLVGITFHILILDYLNAEKYYLRAIEKGLDSALNDLGSLYASKLGRYAEAEKIYLRAIEKGVNFTLYNLGNLYAAKLGRYAEAEKYYLLAIEKGIDSALNGLGDLYAKKLGNYEDAEKYYLLAVEKGIESALNGLGNLYAEKLGRYTEAEKYYLLAIEKDVSYALNGLGYLYATKLGNYENAEKYYLLAIEKGIDSALNDLGNLYYYELGRYAEAEKYYLLAIEKGVNSALYNLGNLYAAKLGRYTEAEKYYLLAIEKGVNSALYNLGNLYAGKLGHYAEAEKYYLLAIEKGIDIALNNLGNLYNYELGRYAEAEKYYLLAIEKGVDEVCNHLGYLYAEKLNNPAKAQQYYRLAIEKGNIEGVNNLAYHFLEQNTNQVEALSLATRLEEEVPKMAYHAHTAACVFLWAGQTERALALGDQFLFDDALIEESYDEYTHFLLLLLANNQYEYLYQYFNSERGIEKQVKDRFKPIWYALMHYMQDQYPSEYLRMGDELSETVKEIISKVESLRKNGA